MRATSRTSLLHAALLAVVAALCWPTTAVRADDAGGESAQAAATKVLEAMKDHDFDKFCQFSTNEFHDMSFRAAIESLQVESFSVGAATDVNSEAKVFAVTMKATFDAAGYTQRMTDLLKDKLDRKELTEAAHAEQMKLLPGQAATLRKEFAGESFSLKVEATKGRWFMADLRVAEPKEK